MDKIILLEDVYGIVTVGKDEKLPEGTISFTVIDQTIKDDNGMSKKSEWTIGRPIKASNLKYATSVFGLPVEKYEEICNLDVLKMIDPDAEWLCVIGFTDLYQNHNNSWVHEGTQLYFNGQHNEEISIYSKKITEDMTLCADTSILAAQYEEIMRREQALKTGK